MLGAYVNCNRDPVPESVYIEVKDLAIIKGTPALRLRFQTNEYSQQCRDDSCSSVKDEEENVEMSQADVSSFIMVLCLSRLDLIRGHVMQHLPDGVDLSKTGLNT